MPVQTNHRILGGKVQLYRRGDSGYWWCAASVSGKQRRASTKEENLALAKTLAEDWFLELRGKSRAGLLKSEKTFQQAADQFTKEYGIITEGQQPTLGRRPQDPPPLTPGPLLRRTRRLRGHRRQGAGVPGAPGDHPAGRRQATRKDDQG